MGLRSIGSLEDVSEEELKRKEDPWMKVSIVIAARNEEKGLGDALATLLALDYPDYEVIVVNDRSTDGTETILKGMAEKDDRLKVINNAILPAGWIGKNYALYLGALKSSGQYLLFTDADVAMKPSTLRRALYYVERNQLDHLALLPKITLPGVFLNVFMIGFSVFFSLFTRLWAARNPKSRAHIGIGAFNLVKSAVYWTIGTHRMIALRPDDDLKLGKLIKKNRFRQEVLSAPDFVSVNWYGSVKEMIQGFRKNAFSGTEYSLVWLFFGTLAHIILVVWPFIAVFCTSGGTQVFYGLTAGALLFSAAYTARLLGLKLFYGVGLPVASLFFIYVVWWAALLTLFKGGIVWRDTFYPLKKLKENII
ncbi:MAG: glycosyltransferase [Elusimicrobia bacterium]|nr:glycosyltransferase [Candidatus Obscuribacterium magneticum]